MIIEINHILPFNREVFGSCIRVSHAIPYNKHITERQGRNTTISLYKPQSYSSSSSPSSRYSSPSPESSFPSPHNAHWPRVTSRYVSSRSRSSSTSVSHSRHSKKKRCKSQLHTRKRSERLTRDTENRSRENNLSYITITTTADKHCQNCRLRSKHLHRDPRNLVRYCSVDKSDDGEYGTASVDVTADVTGKQTEETLSSVGRRVRNQTDGPDWGERRVCSLCSFTAPSAMTSPPSGDASNSEQSSDSSECGSVGQWSTSGSSTESSSSSSDMTSHYSR